jgi:hypothetical protein
MPIEKTIKSLSKAQDYQRRIEETKAILAKEPKTSTFIPLGIGEKVGAFETVQINGYKLTIKKGMMVEVPMSVGITISEYLNITSSAGQDKLADREEVKDGVRVDQALS